MPKDHIKGAVFWQWEHIKLEALEVPIELHVGIAVVFKGHMILTSTCNLIHLRMHSHTQPLCTTNDSQSCAMQCCSNLITRSSNLMKVAHLHHSLIGMTALSQEDHTRCRTSTSHHDGHVLCLATPGLRAVWQNMHGSHAKEIFMPLFLSVLPWKRKHGRRLLKIPLLMLKVFLNVGINAMQFRLKS